MRLREEVLGKKHIHYIHVVLDLTQLERYDEAALLWREIVPLGEEACFGALEPCSAYTCHPIVPLSIVYYSIA